MNTLPGGAIRAGSIEHTGDDAVVSLVCGFHHRDHERQGWDCQMTNGVPMWLPPWWIDTNRTPRRNHTHHLPRYLTPEAA